jgi:hypothetical protein
MSATIANPAVYPSARSHIGVKQSYLVEVVHPALAAVSGAQTPVSKTFTIAGKRIRFLFYVPRLAERLCPALAHNAADDAGTPDLTIHVWDSVSTGVDMPMPWTKAAYFFETLDEPEASREPFCGAYITGEDSINLYDVTGAQAYLWLPDASRIPGWVLAAPGRSLLHWFFSRFGIYLVHGAAVGREKGCVLITAKGGSGKSTTALSCVAAGMGYLSDDYVGIAVGAQIAAHSFYNSAKLTPQSLTNFPELGAYVRDTPPGDNGKSVVYVSEVAPGQMLREAPLAAILIPAFQSTGRTHLAPATKMQAFAALAPTTIFQLALTGASAVAPLKELVLRTPCHFLMLSPDIREVASGIAALLRD